VPFAIPPIAGLHDIWPMVSSEEVTSRVRAPSRAAMAHASVPAWPPPITITSYVITHGKIDGPAGVCLGAQDLVAATPARRPPL
jgi:hypothetical protein